MWLGGWGEVVETNSGLCQEQAEQHKQKSTRFYNHYQWFQNLSSCLLASCTEVQVELQLESYSLAAHYDLK